MKTKKPKTPLAPLPTLALALVEHLDLELGQIEPSPFQPRDDFPMEDLNALAESLKVQGQIHALAVRKVKTNYELLDGERRWRAATLARIKTLRAEVFDCTDQQARQIVLATAIHRQDLNPIEEARVYQAAIYAKDAKGPTDLAEQLGVSQGHVSNRLRLLDLPVWWQTKVISREISERHARAVVPYHDAMDVLHALANDLAAAIVRDELPSVSAWEKRVECIVERVTKKMAKDSVSGDQDQGEDTDDQEDDGDREDAEYMEDLDQEAGDLGEEDEAAGVDDQETSDDEPVAAVPVKSAEEREAERFSRELYSWRCDWQRFLIAEALSTASEEDMLRIALLATVYWDANGTAGAALAEALEGVKTRGKKDQTAAERVMSLQLIDFERVAGETLAAMFWDSREGYSKPSACVPDADVEAVFNALSIDMQEEWERGGRQAGDAGLSDAFWDLFTNDQLTKLHKKYKLGMDVSQHDRSEIINALLDRREPTDPKTPFIPFPKEIAKAKKTS